MIDSILSKILKETKFISESRWSLMWTAPISGSVKAK